MDELGEEGSETCHSPRPAAPPTSAYLTTPHTLPRGISSVQYQSISEKLSCSAEILKEWVDARQDEEGETSYSPLQRCACTSHPPTPLISHDLRSIQASGPRYQSISKFPSHSAKTEIGEVVRESGCARPGKMSETSPNGYATLLSPPLLPILYTPCQASISISIQYNKKKSRSGRGGDSEGLREWVV